MSSRSPAAILFDLTGSAYAVQGNPLHATGSVDVGHVFGVPDPGNSSTAPLINGATFTGQAFDALNYSSLVCLVASNKRSATDGIQFQWSTDGTNWDLVRATTMEQDDAARGFHINHQGRYFRIVYTNGSASQAYFRLGIFHRPVAAGIITRPLGDTIDDDNFAQAVRAVVTAKNNQGDYISIEATQQGNLKVAVQETVQVTGSVEVHTDGAQLVTGTVNLGNWPPVHAVSGSVAVYTQGPQAVSGTVTITATGSLPVTISGQPVQVTGSVGIGGPVAAQVTNFPTVQKVWDPGTQAVSGSVSVYTQGPQLVSGTLAVSGTQLTGSTFNGYPIVTAGVDSDNKLRAMRVDELGRVILSPSSIGTKVMLVSDALLAANGVNYLDYPIQSGSTLELNYFYAGADGGPLRATLTGHATGTTNFILNGDMENSASVQAWAAVAGSFTAPSPDLSTVQAFTGTGSFRWVYASSATALQRRQTFATAQDFSGYRYIRVRFFNDSAVGVTRTISLILASGTPTRTYSLAVLLPNAQMQSGSWTTLTADLESPTSTTGTGFNLKSITTVTLFMQDSANRTGTVYWDAVRLEDQFDVRHRIYSATGDSIDLAFSPSEDFVSGSTSGSIYIVMKNVGNTAINATAAAGGYLVPTT